MPRLVRIRRAGHALRDVTHVLLVHEVPEQLHARGPGRTPPLPRMSRRGWQGDGGGDIVEGGLAGGGGDEETGVVAGWGDVLHEGSLALTEELFQGQEVACG